MTALGNDWPRPDRDDWRERAACKGMGPDLFYPVDNDGPLTSTRGRAVCAGCTVRDECLDDAIDRGEVYGIWGGVTWRTRRDLRRERAS